MHLIQLSLDGSIRKLVSQAMVQLAENVQLIICVELERYIYK